MKEMETSNLWWLLACVVILCACVAAVPAAPSPAKPIIQVAGGNTTLQLNDTILSCLGRVNLCFPERYLMTYCSQATWSGLDLGSPHHPCLPTWPFSPPYLGQTAGLQLRARHVGYCHPLHPRCRLHYPRWISMVAADKAVVIDRSSLTYDSDTAAMVFLPRHPATWANWYDAADLMVDFFENHTLDQGFSFTFEVHAEGLVGTVGLGFVRSRPQDTVAWCGERDQHCNG